MLPRGPFVTIPNLLSLSRLLLLPVFLWSMVTPGQLWLLASLVTYAVISDVLDGYLARRLNQASEWGRLLDPLADKVAVAVALVYCYIDRGLPLWILILILGRDILIMVFAPRCSTQPGELPGSILSGRLAALSFALLAGAYLLNWEPGKLPMLAVSTVLLFYSSLQYAKRLNQHAH